MRIIVVTSRRPALSWLIKFIASNERISIYYCTSLFLKPSVLASWCRVFFATSMVKNPRVFHYRSGDAPLQDNHRVSGSDKLI